MVRSYRRVGSRLKRLTSWRPLPAREQLRPVGDAGDEMARAGRCRTGRRGGSATTRFVSLCAVPWPPTLTTTVTELPESRVRVEAEVPAAEVAKRVDAGRARRSPAACASPASAPARRRPPVVIKRVGREAVLDEAVRESIGGWYAAAIDDAQRRAGRRARPRPLRPARRGRAAEVLDRDRRAPEGQARRLQGPRGPAPRARRRRRGDRRGARAAARALRQARDRRPPRPARRLRGDGLRRQRRRHAVRRRRGPRPDGRARLRPARARLRGAARGRRRPARTAPSRSPSPRTTRPPSWPARRPSSRSRSRRSRPRTSPSSTTSSPPRPASTRSTSCARTSARRIAEAEYLPHRGRVPRGRARRRRRQRDGRGARRARRGPRARAVGPDAALALAPGHLQGGLPAHLRPRGGRDRRGRQGGRRARRCAARPCWRRSSRPRGSSPPRRSCSRRSARRAEGDVAQEAARAPEVRGPAGQPQGGPRAAQARWTS